MIFVLTGSVRYRVRHYATCGLTSLEVGASNPWQLPESRYRWIRMSATPKPYWIRKQVK
jgi:hypothetical protein